MKYPPQHFMSLRDTPNYEKDRLFIAEAQRAQRSALDRIFMKHLDFLGLDFSNQESFLILLILSKSLGFSPRSLRLCGEAFKRFFQL